MVGVAIGEETSAVAIVVGCMRGVRRGIEVSPAQKLCPIYLLVCMSTSSWFPFLSLFLYLFD